MRKLSETTKILTLGWTPPANCIGYVYYVNDRRVSNTWDPTTNQARFGKIAGATYKVVAVGVGATGKYPPDPVSNAEDYSEDPYGTAVYSH